MIKGFNFNNLTITIISILSSVVIYFLSISKIAYCFLLFCFIYEDLKLSKNIYIRKLQLVFFTFFLVSLLKIYVIPIIVFIIPVIENINHFIGINTIFLDSDSEYETDSENSKKKPKIKSVDAVDGSSMSKKGWFDATLTHKPSDNTLEAAKEIGSRVSKGIEKCFEKLGEGLANGLGTIGVKGGTAYALKNSSLPPTAKAGIIVASGLTASVGNNLLPKLGKSKDISPKSSHPNSLSEGPTGEFAPSSPNEETGSDFIYTLFGVDPNNILASIIFDLLCLSFLTLYFIYSLALFLFYVYIYNNYNLDWFDNNKYLSPNLSRKLKTFFKKFSVR
jgi:hypothetical protein